MSLLDRLCGNKNYNHYYQFYKDFSITPPDNFNFGFDVMDVMGDTHRDELALLWVSPDGEEYRFSFGDIKRLSAKAANAFKGLGLKKGDVVLLALRRHYQFWYALMGLHKLGAIVIPVTHQLTPRDYAYRMNAASAKAIITTLEDGVPPNVRLAMNGAPTMQYTLAARSPRMKNAPLPEGFLDFDALVEQASEHFPRPEGADFAGGDGDTMLIYFTSGTTGYPKMVAHSHNYPLGHIVTARYWHNCKPGALHLTISDTGWAKAAWGKLYGQWLCESAVFVYDFDRFNAADILKKLEYYRVNTFCAPPTMYRYIIREPLEDYDLSALNYATTAGEALNPEVFERFRAKTGLDIHEGFGQTETTMVLATFPCMDIRVGAMGLPTPGYDVQVLDSEGKPATLGETGEICISYAQGKPVGMAQGYYRDEALTNRAWRDGWYHTGDTAWQDGMGYFWYVGRTDDVIKSSGYRIGPFEVESSLMEHPAVLECAVTPVPDPVRGQIVKATIVLARGYTASEELRKELQQHVKKATAPYKYPRVLEFTDVLPKTISGKIKRAEIRERDRLKYLGPRGQTNQELISVD